MSLLLCQEEIFLSIQKDGIGHSRERALALLFEALSVFNFLAGLFSEIISMNSFWLLLLTSLYRGCSDCLFEFRGVTSITEYTVAFFCLLAF